MINSKLKKTNSRLAFQLAAFLCLSCSTAKPTQKKHITIPAQNATTAEQVDDQTKDNIEKIQKDQKGKVEEPESMNPDGESVADTSMGMKFFQESVYPLMTLWCQNCHLSGKQPPLIADSTATLAYQEIMLKHLVDFKDTQKSRIYLRLAKENHNCPPDPGCTKASETLLAKIDEWAKVENIVSEKSPLDNNPATTTAAKLLSEKIAARSDAGLPPGSLYFPAESATLKAPFVLKDRTDAEGGKSITTGVGAVDQTNIGNAATDATLGTLVFNIDIKTAGIYHVVGRVLSPNQNQGASSSFYLKFDNNPLQIWDYPATNNMFLYDKADAAPATGVPLAFDLTAGPHTLEIRQRQAGVEIDSIIVTSNLTYDFSIFAAAERSFNRLEFDFAQQSGIPGAKIMLDIADYDVKSYLIKNPELILPQGSGSLKIKNLKVLINDRFLPQHATYTSVQETVAAPGKILSQASLIALKDKGSMEDKFSVTFESIEKIP